ncbi:hypothetical protein ABZX88_06810 [Kitasatospora aureofaciens]|uniref:hypothetical protein n=1 Tax=Kitasatospora aureofaciens TaxID=1894 RepID=UPI0033A71F35
MRNKRLAILGVAAGTALLAGCGSSGTANTSGGAKSQTAEGAQGTAVRYQQAINAHDWATMCQLETTAYQGGSLQKCTTDNAESTPPPVSASPSTSPAKPLVRADGSTVPPMATPSPADTRPATIGPVTAERTEQVPALSQHPAGTGVMVVFQVTQPAGTSSTERRAIRLVQDGAGWKVDQDGDVHDSDMTVSDPLRAALAVAP